MARLPLQMNPRLKQTLKRLLITQLKKMES